MVYNNPILFDLEHSMRILFDSKKPQFKTPFGTLVPGQECRLCIHIPASVEAKQVECRIQHQDGSPAMTVSLEREDDQDLYHRFAGTFSFAHTGLFFYYFYNYLI